MKKLLGLLVLTAVFAFGQNAAAQNNKFGHINSEELFSIMPERDTVVTQLQELQTELQNALEIMQVEYANKLNDYNEQVATLTEIVRQVKADELNQISTRITNFEQGAQQQMNQSQMELMQPIIQRAEDAIKDVAREGKFLYIYDLASRSILYFDEARSVDILPMVKAKLGIE